VSEPVARSPITPVPPVEVVDGWEVSTRRADGELTLADHTPLAKVSVRSGAPRVLDVPFGRAARTADGVLVVGASPGEWLLLGPPGSAAGLMGRAETMNEATCVDLTHGRALLRLRGARSAAVLAKLSGVDLRDDAVPDGAAFRTSVAALATDIIRDDDGETRSYLLHCERSSGQYLFDALLEAGGEFGIEIDGFTSRAA
jgi:heterotetrameric sarcosine oxidase gamma subunit